MNNSDFNPYKFTFKKGRLNTGIGLFRRYVPIVVADWDELIDVPDRILAYIASSATLMHINENIKPIKYVFMYAWYRLYPDHDNVLMLTSNFIPDEARKEYPTYFLGYYIMRWKDVLRFVRKDDNTIIIVFAATDSIDNIVTVDKIDIEKDIKDKELYQTCQLLKANLITAGLNISLIGDDPL